MKKSKILLSGLAATVFAASAGALIACDSDVSLPVGQVETYTITFHAGEGATLVGDSTITVAGGVINGTIPTAKKTDYTFKGWSFTAGGTVDFTADNATADMFTASADAYAVFTKKQTNPDTKPTGVYKITLDGGEHGTPEKEFVQTANGKLAELPKVTKVDDGWKFTVWFDNDGKTVTTDTVFTADATITAQYEEEKKQEENEGVYTIGFDGGEHGIVSKQSAKTTKGKLNTSDYPTVTPDEGWIHVGWEDEDGNAASLGDTFEADTTLTAIYDVDTVAQAPAIMYVNGEVSLAMDLNENMDAEAVANGMDLEYLILGTDLEEGDVLTFQWRNDEGELEDIMFYIATDSQGVDKSNYSQEVSSLTVTKTATFPTIALKHNTKDIDGSDKLSWAVYATDGTTFTYEDGYYLIGEMTTWELDNDYYLEDNTLEIELPAGQEFKIGSCKDGKKFWGDAGKDKFDWYQLDAASKGRSYIENAGAPDNNVKLTKAGTYIITVTGGEWSITLKGASDDDDDDNPKPVKDGVYVGNSFYPLTFNMNTSETQKEYWLGGSKITLAKGDKISIKMDGEPISAYIEPSSAGVDKSVTDKALSEFTVTVAGQFEIYLHKNLNADGTLKDWSVQLAGPTEVNTTDTIPAGCAKVEITFTGNNVVTLYLVDVNGKAVGASDLSKFAIYSFSGEVFGTWATSITTGQLKSTMTISGALPSGWVFRWGTFNGDANQTSDIKDTIKAGKTYVITLKAKSSGEDSIIKEYTGTEQGGGNGQGGEDPDNPDNPDNPDKPTIDAKLKYGNSEIGLTKSTPDATDKSIVWQMATQSLQLTKGDTISFTVDGDAIQVYVQGKVTGCACKGEHTCKVALSVVNSRVATFTVTATGKYDFYLKYYGELVGSTGGYSLWVEGPEAEDSGEITPTPSGGYITGTFNEWGVGPALKGPTTNAYDQTEYSATFTTTKAGEQIKVLLNDIWYAHLQSDVPASVATGGGFTNDASDITITSAGTYDLYLKIYREGDNNDGSHDIWIQKSSSTGGGEQGGGDVTDPDPAKKADGAYVGGTLKVAMTKNAGVTKDLQYWLGGSDTTVNLTKGDKVSFYIDNTLIKAYIFAGSAGIEMPSTSTAYTEFTVTVTGPFKLYLTKYSDTGSWVIEFGGPTELGDAIEIPASASYVDILFKENKTVRVYIKEGNNFVSPTNFYFHTWGSGGDTSWPGTKITGTTLNMSNVTISSSTNFIFNKGNGQPQTQNMSGLTAGGTFVLTFNGNNSTLAPGVVK